MEEVRLTIWICGKMKHKERKEGRRRIATSGGSTGNERLITQQAPVDSRFVGLTYIQVDSSTVYYTGKKTRTCMHMICARVPSQLLAKTRVGVCVYSCVGAGAGGDGGAWLPGGDLQ